MAEDKRQEQSTAVGFEKKRGAFILKRILAALATVVVLGTYGYMLLEQMTLQDAFLSAVSVMATVGLPEGLSASGKVFTSVLIVSSIGLIITAAVKHVIKPAQEEELLSGFFNSSKGGMIMKEVKVNKKNHIAGLTKARIIQEYGLVVVGIKNKAGFDVDIPLSFRVKVGESVLLLGSPGALLGFKRG